VDDGTEGSYEGEIQLRAKLQNCIAAKTIPKSKYVIVICATSRKESNKG